MGGGCGKFAIHFSTGPRCYSMLYEDGDRNWNGGRYGERFSENDGTMVKKRMKLAAG